MNKKPTTLAEAMKRIEELEKRVAALESRPPITIINEKAAPPWPWNPGNPYAPMQPPGGTVAPYPDLPQTWCHSGNDKSNGKIMWVGETFVYTANAKVG